MTEIFRQDLSIPKIRVPVVIGKDGIEKKELERITETKININKDGEVIISSEDSFKVWLAKQIIKAIGRGFSPHSAKLLLNDNYCFELIELKDWAKSDKALDRLRGRVIGEGGKSRKTIEDLTNGKISVYGKTIGLIAESTNVHVMRKAIEMLLSGSRHSTVFKMLEKECKKV